MESEGFRAFLIALKSVNLACFFIVDSVYFTYKWDGNPYGGRRKAAAFSFRQHCKSFRA